MNSDEVIFANDNVKESYIDLAKSLKIPTLSVVILKDMKNNTLSFITIRF